MTATLVEVAPTGMLFDVGSGDHLVSLTVEHRPVTRGDGTLIEIQDWYSWRCTCGDTPQAAFSHQPIALTMGARHAERGPLLSHVKP